MRDLAQAELFMLDMDGTFYLEDTLLPGAADFLDICRRVGARFTFLTNNSSKSRGAYLEKLARLGVQVAEEELFTSGDATLQYLEAEGYPRDILLIGTESLCAQFAARGYNVAAQAPQLVVLGFDTTLNYEKLTALCRAVRRGLPYIATHPDLNCPAEGGYIPDIGATIAYVQAATGRLPNAVIGKPNALIARAVAERAGLPVQALCMVGDRLATDIALGASGVGTALVLSGETTREDLEATDLKPDFVYQDLAEMGAALLAAHGLG